MLKTFVFCLCALVAAPAFATDQAVRVQVHAQNRQRIERVLIAGQHDVQRVLAARERQRVRDAIRRDALRRADVRAAIQRQALRDSILFQREVDRLNFERAFARNRNSALLQLNLGTRQRIRDRELFLDRQFLRTGRAPLLQLNF